MINNYEGILNWIKENDIMTLDLGFRSSLGVLRCFGIDFAVLSFLDNNQQQFNVHEGNNSRLVTMLQWVV